MGGTPNRLTLFAILGAALCAAGCDDAHEVIDSRGGIDEGLIDPDDDPDNPRPGTDMGPDWGADADPEGGMDAGGSDDDDWSDGQEIDEDADPPLATGDMGPGHADDDYAVPDGFLAGDLGLPPDDEPDGPGDETGELDPTALWPPLCGMFGPADAVAFGPTLAATWLHGSPGVLFDEPAFAGCSPTRLWGGDPQRLWQEMTFDYRWDRVVGWRWRIHTLDGAGFHIAGTETFDGIGRIARATYDCVGALEPETHTFFYGPQDRLLQVVVDRPEGCEPMAAAENRSVRYRYGEDPWLPVARSVTLADGRMAEVELAYARDEAGRVIEIREWPAPDEVGEVRRFTYDDAGRITEVAVRPSGLVGREQVTRYTYDDLGRLVTRESNEAMLEVGYDAAGDIEFVNATNRPVVRNLRFPERSRLEQISMDADPVAEARANAEQP